MIDSLFSFGGIMLQKGIAYYSKVEVGKQLISCTLRHASHGWM